MNVFQSSYQAVTVAQALQQLTPLEGDFDAARHAPILSINVNELIHTVGVLWTAVREQRSFMDILEKEMSKRKTEMEVRFKTMQSEMDGMLSQEARKRQAEDEKLRQEIGVAREEVIRVADTIKRETKESLDASQKVVERALSVVKVSISEAQQKVSDVYGEVSHVKDDAARIRSSVDTLQTAIDKARTEAQTNFATVCSFIGANVPLVQQAVSNGTEKDAMLKTPALVAIAQRIRLADEKGEAAKGEAAKAWSEAQQATVATTRLSSEIAKVESGLSLLEQVLRDSIVSGDEKLSRRIDDLEKNMNSIASLAATTRGGNNNAASQLPTADFCKKSELDTVLAMLELLKKDVTGRLSLKADQEGVLELSSTVAKHEDDIANLMSQDRTLPPREQSSSPAPPTTSGRIPSYIDEAIEDFQRRIETLEATVLHLEKGKADRGEMRLALADLAKKIEQGLTELYNQIQAIKQRPEPMYQQQQQSQDATAGRFRCISCNRDAGPLQEQIQERISKSQFPPSPMIVSQATSASSQQQPQRSIVQSRQAVPGLREYGGALTSSRKKLMNYYVWLQEKNDANGPNAGPSQGGQNRPRPSSAGKVREGGGATATTSPRSTSPGGTVHPPTHPWTGAQSGNGAYGERQCGDHGSPEPEAVGLDGKYYVGVHSSGAGRPRSAPLQGRADPVAQPPPAPQ